MNNDLTILPSVKISSTALDAEARRMEVIANNVANANTTKGPDGRIFRRKEVVFAEKLAEAIDGSGKHNQPGGVEIKGIVEDTRPAKQVYRPGHPDADANGYMSMPDINVVEEMVDMMSSTRAYEANLAAIRAAKGMAEKAFGIGK